MIGKVTRNILIVGVIVGIGLALSSGSIEKWQEVKARILNVAGQVPSAEEAVTPAPPETPLDTLEAAETKEVTLYFTDAEGKALHAEKKAIPKVDGIAKATLEALVAGPDSQGGNFPVLPQGVKVLGVNIKEDGLAIVDFSPELVANHPPDAKMERMTVAAIVNTLTQFPTIERVKILVNGYEKDTLAGNENISGELMRDDSVVDNVQK